MRNHPEVTQCALEMLRGGKYILLITVSIFFSCGDPLFLSYQVKKNTTLNVFPSDAKSIKDVTVISTPDSYQMMHSVYSAFMIEIYNNSEKNITVEPGKITLKYDKGTSGTIKPKKKYQSFEVEPGEMCDMKLSYEDPFSESREKKGFAKVLEIPIILYDGLTQRTEVFVFNSFSETVRENKKH